LVTCNESTWGNVFTTRQRALLALALLVPAPTIGVVCAMLLPATAGTPLGQAIYFASKAWILLVPLLWLLFVERGRWSLSPPQRGGFGIAALLGVVISLVIFGAFRLLEDMIDAKIVREAATTSGIDTRAVYLGLAVYIFTINAVLEEYVWRWFVFRQCEKLMSGGRIAARTVGRTAVLLSALLFTAHHVCALAAQFDITITMLGSFGVFIGGAVWSWCYLRYRSIWPGYVSHAIVDVTIFAIGWKLIFP
jgi:membrane protease YdiL (CAAX protease family)